MDPIRIDALPLNQATIEVLGDAERGLMIDEIAARLVERGYPGPATRLEDELPETLERCNGAFEGFGQGPWGLREDVSTDPAKIDFI